MSCSICQQEITTDEISFCCEQKYHYECLSNWMVSEQGQSCPICRNRVSNSILLLFKEINLRKELINSTIQYSDIELIPPPPQPRQPRLRRYQSNIFQDVGIIPTRDVSMLARQNCGYPWYYCSCGFHW